MAEVGFRAPLAIPLGLYQGEVFVEPAPTNAGYASMLALWMGGAQLGGGDDGGGGVTPIPAFYIPTFRPRRR